MNHIQTIQTIRQSTGCDGSLTIYGISSAFHRVRRKLDALGFIVLLLDVGHIFATTFLYTDNGISNAFNVQTFIFLVVVVVVVVVVVAMSNAK